MRKFAVNFARIASRHAGGKARGDLIDILVANGWEEFHINRGSSNFSKIAFRIMTPLRLALMPRDTVFCIQFPNYTGYGKWIMDFIARRFPSVAVIHDIDSIRGEDSLKDEKVLERFSICVATGDLDKVSPKGARFEPDIRLEMIDYLIDPGCPETPWSPDGKILFAGRLSPAKSGWIYDKGRNDFGLLLYGIEFEEARANPADRYAGSFDPSSPVIAEPVSWGLIWDGDTLDTCSGPMGEYQRYNHPHKLSLYLALGLPVIIWKEAAAARFVLEHDVGIAVGSLKDVGEVIRSLGPDRIQALRNNALAVMAEIRAGNYMKQTMEKALKVATEPRR